MNRSMVGSSPPRMAARRQSICRGDQFLASFLLLANLFASQSCPMNPEGTTRQDVVATPFFNSYGPGQTRWRRRHFSHTRRCCVGGLGEGGGEKTGSWVLWLDHERGGGVSLWPTTSPGSEAVQSVRLVDVRTGMTRGSACQSPDRCALSHSATDHRGPRSRERQRAAEEGFGPRER